MNYRMTLNSKYGPYQFSVKHFENHAELWIPTMVTPINMFNNGLIISLSVTGNPVPIDIEANWIKEVKP